MKGIVVAVLGICFGVWLAWRGLTNDIWIDSFGEAVIPKWMYVLAGFGCSLISAGLLFVLLKLGGWIDF